MPQIGKSCQIIEKRLGISYLREKGCDYVSEISEKIADFFVEKEVISEDDYKIYRYGADVFIENYFMTFILIFIGGVIGKGICTITYILTFVSVRRYSGGYHASTKAGCHIVTLGNWMIVILFVSLQQKYHVIEWWTACIICILVYGIMYLLVPVENVKKKLLRSIRIKNRKKSLILCQVMIVFLLMFWFKLPQVSFAMLVSLIEVALLILVGKKDK